MKKINRNIFNTPHKDLTKVRRLPYVKDDMYQLKKLFKTAMNSGFYSGGGSKRRRLEYEHVPYQHSTDQRVTFKMSYSNTISSHKKYLTNYMIQKEHDEIIDKPELFGSDYEEYEKNMVPLNFKFIISPENQNVDLEVLVKDFIKRTELFTGYKFYWQAAIHTNTDHKHAHICINGKDMNGEKVRFRKEWIKKNFRDELSYIATQMVGERTEKEIEAGIKKLPYAKRWTKLDEEIKAMGNYITLSPLMNSVIQERVAFIASLNLAKKINANTYKIDDDYEEVLTATGRYNTYLENYIQFNGNLEMYNGKSIQGKVIKTITFDKDESWNDAIIVQKGNKNIYVPIWQLQKDNLFDKKVNINQKKEGTIARQIKDSDISIVD